MIFITKVELKNFQSHENTTLEFHRGLNVIVGNSDSGKTAILRAIKWALYNEPLGDYFIKQGEKDVSVTIHFNTNAIVRRYRSSSKNTYYLKKSDGEEYTFDGFGQRVPKEIIDEIEMDKINLDEKSTSIINIAEQLEGPFLLNEKSSIRASAIGRLVGVNYIDDALRETIRDNKQINSNIKNLYIRKENLEEDLKKFDYLDKAEEDLNNLKKIRTLILDNQSKLNLLINFNENLKNLNAKIEINEEIYSKYTNLDLIAEKIYLAENNLNNLKRFRRYSEEIKRANINIKNNQILINKFIDIDKLNSNLLLLDFKLKNYKKYTNLYSNLIKLKEQKNSLKYLLDKYIYLDELYVKARSLDESIYRYNKLSKLNKNYNYTNKRINDGLIFLNKLSYIGEFEEDINTIYVKNKKLEKLKVSLLDYQNLSLKISKRDKELKILNYNLDEDMKTYNTLLLDLGYCPFCRSKIDNNTLEHINQHFLR